VATNGECFWPGDRADEAAHALAAAGWAIIGGEVYCRRAVGWAAYLGEWFTPLPPGGALAPADAVAVGLAEALRVIRCEPAVWGEPNEPRSNLRFFFASSPAPRH
jgi:hypothetical protein